MVLSEMINLIISKGHSRVPVYSGSPTNIVGLILVSFFFPRNFTSSTSVITLQHFHCIFNYSSISLPFVQPLGEEFDKISS